LDVVLEVRRDDLRISSIGESVRNAALRRKHLQESDSKATDDERRHRRDDEQLNQREAAVVPSPPTKGA
jgi:hypothetical protein